MGKSPEEMAASMLANLEDKTGHQLDHWLTIVKKTALEKHGRIVKMLKTDHGVTHGYANLIAHQYLSADQAEVDLVAQQYSGKKAGLKPIYDALVEMVRGFGDDVEISPKKTYVSLRRNKQFGLIQPSTMTRVDVGLNSRSGEAGDRLEVSGSFNQMVSHRVRLTAVEEVDKELEAWLKQAYSEA